MHGKSWPIAALACGALALAASRGAADVIVNTGDPDGLMATASRPESAGKIEIESADDFILTKDARLDSATFTGLLVNGDQSNIGQVRVEIYRVFPLDSDTGRTPNVPTRVNSPSDVAFADRDTAAGNLTFATSKLSDSFTAGNSVLNGINPKPNQTTMGEGPVTGAEVRFTTSFTTPLLLPAGHYFFIPQVEITTADGNFFWLSAPKPIVAPGTPFLGDLQSWIRNANLDPDWLRIGTDIEGQGRTFNASFSLNGQLLPEPATWAMLASGLLPVIGLLRRRRKA